jgi:hypothetical protein
MMYIIHLPLPKDDTYYILTAAQSIIFFGGFAWNGISYMAKPTVPYATHTSRIPTSRTSYTLIC